MFNYIDCWLGNTLVTKRTPNQVFCAIVETLTSHGQDAAKGYLQSNLFFADTANEMDNTNNKKQLQNSVHLYV